MKSLTVLLVLLAACGSPSPPVSSPTIVASSAKREPAPRRPFQNPGGIWMPSQMSSQVETLRSLGLSINPEQLSEPSSSLLGSVVYFSGCSASFVSKDGLIVTNHHCAVHALQYNSNPQNNLLETGFLATSRAEERSSGPMARVFVTLAITDITDDVRSALASVNDDFARQRAYEKKQKEAVARCESARPNRRCQLVSFYDGLKYALIERLELRDVRIVYAPPDGIGNFGGEIDNWRWPRHSGDVTFLRAYVDKNQNVADYSPENVPYRSTHFLKISESQLSEGDLVMVLGYPGQTSRLKFAREVEDVMTWLYPRRLGMYDAYISRLETIGAGDPDAKIKASSWVHGFSNYRIKHKGELEGVQRGKLLESKRADAAKLAAFMQKDAATAKSYGNVLEQMEAALSDFAKTREADAALQTEIMMPRLLSAAGRIVRMAEERARPDSERDPQYQARNFNNLRDELKAVDRLYHPTLDKAVLELALERALQTPAEQRTPAVVAIAGNDANRESIQRAVDKLYSKTKLTDQKLRLELFDNKTSAELARHPDSLIRLAVALRPLQRAAEERQKRLSGKMLALKPLYMKALLEMLGGAVAPDANGTLRVAYGTVQGEELSLERRSRPFTILQEVLKKHQGKPPFDAPARLLRAIRERRGKGYVDPKLGDVPVDFLSDTNITNGSSGSACLNARGELTGLAFDGTYESVASDWLVLPYARSIYVDIRYVLFLLDEVEHATALLSELGVASRSSTKTLPESSSQTPPAPPP